MGLVFRIVTRGENQEALRASVEAIHTAFAGYAERSGPYQSEVVSDRFLALPGPSTETKLYVVPVSYQTPRGSRFKARALHYLHEQARQDSDAWRVYLDEESRVDASLLTGLYRFVQDALSQVASGGQAPIGQGGDPLRRGGGDSSAGPTRFGRRTTWGASACNTPPAGPGSEPMGRSS